MSLSPELTLAAYLADPLAPLDSRSLAGLESLPKLLRRNRVSLLPAERASPDWMRALLAEEPLAAYLNGERSAYECVRREYASIRMAFAQAGISDVLIKSAGVAPSFPHLSDNVDDLVAAEHIPAARTALLSLGYVELRNLEEPRKFFFKRFASGQEVAAHHLHEHVGWAVSFLDEPLLMQRARPAPDDADLLVPHPEDAFLITTAHALYENKAIKLGDVAKVRHCLRSGQVDWRRVRVLAEGKGWLDGLNIIVCIFSRLDTELYGATLFPAETVEQAEAALPAAHRRFLESLFSQPLQLPLPIAFTFSKGLFYAKCVHDRYRRPAAKVYDVVRHTLNGAKLKLRVHSQPSMLITFSGIDGAGKTRHAQALINALQRCDIRTSYVWSRSGSSPLADAAIRLGKRLLGRPPSPVAATQEQRAAGRREMTRRPLVRWGWQAIVSLDLLIHYTRRVWLPLLIGRVVVCDRYVYDALADLANDTGQMGGAPSRLLALLSPRPSPIAWLCPSPLPPNGERGEGCQEGEVRAAFLLTLPPDQAQARRPEDRSILPAVAAQSRAFDHLAQEYGLIIIDNTQPFGDVNDQIVRAVVRSYFSRYHTLINALFMANPDRSSQ